MRSTPYQNGAPQRAVEEQANGLLSVGHCGLPEGERRPCSKHETVHWAIPGYACWALNVHTLILAVPGGACTFFLLTACQAHAHLQPSGAVWVAQARRTLRICVSSCTGAPASLSCQHDMCPDRGSRCLMQRARRGAHHSQMGYKGPSMAGVVRFCGMPISAKPDRRGWNAISIMRTRGAPEICPILVVAWQYSSHNPSCGSGLQVAGNALRPSRRLAPCQQRLVVIS